MKKEIFACGQIRTAPQVAARSCPAQGGRPHPATGCSPLPHAEAMIASRGNTMVLYRTRQQLLLRQIVASLPLSDHWKSSTMMIALRGQFWPIGEPCQRSFLGVMSRNDR